jgi:hypothetical protein
MDPETRRRRPTAVTTRPARPASPARLSALAAALGIVAAAAALLLAPPAPSARAQGDLGIDTNFSARAGGGAPVWEVLPGESVFWADVPENIREREKCEKVSVSSNEAVKVTGELNVKYETADYGLFAEEKKPPEVRCWFTRKDGSKWSIWPERSAVMTRGSIRPSDPKQAYVFGPTQFGNPLEPRQRLVFRLRGKARLRKDDKEVATNVPFDLVLGSVTRDRDTGRYKVKHNEVESEGLEGKLLVPDSYEVPGHGKGLSILFCGGTASENL